MEKCDKLGRNSMCLNPTSKHDSDITAIKKVWFHNHTRVIKERCQTGGLRESNGRQVIVSSCWQREDRGLQAGPIGRGSKTSELPLSMQTTLHAVTKSTGPDRLPELKHQTGETFSNSVHIISTKQIGLTKCDALIFKCCVIFDLGW